jgi:VWFA-related protein
MCPAVPNTTYFIAALFILLFVTAPLACAQALAKKEDSTPSFTFKSGVSNVRVDLQVVEKGEVVNDLAQQDFVVYDENQPQKILYFGHEAEPLSLLLLFDVSGSMRKHVEQVGKVAGTALKQLRPGDRVAVMLFSKGTKVKLGFTSDLSTVASVVRDSAQDETMSTATAVNEGLLDAADYMKEKAGDAGRRAVLIVTDNLGLNYQVPDQKVITALNEADTVLNAIVVGKGERPEPPRPGRYVNPDFTPFDVFTISEETGGEAIKAARAADAFGELVERIRTRYSIQYRMPDNATLGFHKVRIELTQAALARHPYAQIRARKGYFVKPSM